MHTPSHAPTDSPTHRDADLHNPEAKHIPKTAGCTARERESFTALLEVGGWVGAAEGSYTAEGFVGSPVGRALRKPSATPSPTARRPSPVAHRPPPTAHSPVALDLQ